MLSMWGFGWPAGNRSHRAARNQTGQPERRHVSDATITIGCGLARRSTADATTVLDRGYAGGRASSVS
jgi:hypothetical protein